MSSQLRWGVNKYQDASSRMSPALLRARSRYTRRNIATGVIIAGIAVSIYTYAATATGSDDFSDVPMPPVPEKAVEQLRRDREGKGHT
ncbi:hypothetical protein V1525DRAFT_385105 [Lipomyces kononenkoae]|uniref:Uncharacterized protein n=1 Tax=Lipomyces kononenkoae TaxID=34357 RepID=A0ACC3TA68_LIPKO